MSMSLDESCLPPTKIKRQYKCAMCPHITVNPRIHLRHRQQVHNDKIRIVECPLCVYACQYRQKLNRHLKLVHHRMPNQLRKISSTNVAALGAQFAMPSTSSSAANDNLMSSHILDQHLLYAAHQQQLQQQHQNMQQAAMAHQNASYSTLSNQDPQQQLQQLIKSLISDMHPFVNNTVNINDEPVDLSIH